MFVLLLALGLAVAACGRARPPRVAPPPPPPPSGAALRVLVDGAVRSTALEEYVAGCVVAELGSPRTDAAAAQRAREVQAILCRSYATASRNRHGANGFDVCATTHCQVYRAVPSTETGRLAREAAARTKGVVLAFEGRAVRPVYHAACGGKTSAAQDVWPGDGEPWLRTVADEACARRPPWTFRLEMKELERALAEDGRMSAAVPLRDVEVASRDAAGRAATLRLVGKSTMVVRGDDFRLAVIRAFGPQSLASTMFSVQRAGRRLTFEGRGNGHGVGLCQMGAVRLAAQGQAPEAILRRYYPGTTLIRLN